MITIIVNVEARGGRREMGAENVGENAKKGAASISRDPRTYEPEISDFTCKIFLKAIGSGRRVSHRCDRYLRLMFASLYASRVFPHSSVFRFQVFTLIPFCTRCSRTSSNRKFSSFKYFFLFFACV